MLPKLQAHYIQAFTNYKSAAGTQAGTALVAGIQFENGLYVGGTFSAAGLPLTTDNITISGTAGNGYIQYAAQTVAPSLGGAHIYATSGGRIALGHSGTSGFNIIFGNDVLTANRTYTAPDKNGTFALVGDNVSEFTNDANFVVGPGGAVSGRLPSFNGTTGALIQDSGILASDVVSGPSSAVTGRIASFNGTTGKLIQDSGILASSVVLTSRTLTEGAGLAGNTYDLSANRTLAMGTPSTLSIASTNAASGTTHAHLITSSSNPGAATALLSSNASGYLQLVRVGIGVAPTQPLHVAGNAFIDAATANLYLKDTSTGFQAATTLIITPQSGNTFRNAAYTSGLVGWNISDTGNAEFNNVDIRGAIHAGIITYNQLQTTAGTFLVTKSAAKLKTDVTIPSSPTYGTTTVNIDVVDPDGIAHASGQLFAVNDVLRLKDGLVGDTWFTVSSASDQTTFWRYVCKIQAGTNNVTYRAGLGVPDFGTSGYGFIMMTADQTNAPYLQMATHAATFSSANSSGTLVVTPQLRLGNLNGSYGYVTDIYGLGSGQYGAASKSWVTVDQTNGFRVGNNTTVLGQWDVSGNATFGQVATNKANVYWNASNNRLEFRGGASGTDVHSYVDQNGYLVFGDGNSYLNSDGLTVAASGLAALSWKNTSGTQVGMVTNTYTINSAMLIAENLPATNTTGLAQLTLQSDNDAGNGTRVAIVKQGTTAASNAGKGYIIIRDTNSDADFKGVTIGTSAVPTHMLDVYGTGYFQGNLTLGSAPGGGNLNVHTGTNRNLIIEDDSGGPRIRAVNDANSSSVTWQMYGPIIAASGPYSFNGTVKSLNTSTGFVEGYTVENASTSGSAKGMAINFYGTDTVGTRKYVGQIGVEHDSEANFTQSRMVFSVQSSGSVLEALRLKSNRTIQIAGYGAGTLSTDASGNITASSDEKLKTNIRTFRKGLIALKKLEPILYRWNKKSGLDSKHDYVGFGARHTKRHIPEAVGKGRDGFHTMSDRAILATAVNAIKELEQMYATR